MNDTSAVGTDKLQLDLEFIPAPGIAIDVHECRKPRGGWSTPELLGQHALVFVRKGGFRIRLDGKEDYLGPSAAYFERRDAEYQTLHPDDNGDTTAMFFFSDDALARHVHNGAVPTMPLVCDGGIDLSQRRLIRALAEGIDAFEADERIAWLIGALLELAGDPPPQAARERTRRAHGRIVSMAKEAIALDPAGIDLGSLAALVGHSPFHVSRVFRKSVGIPLTQFRNRVRVATALTHLEQGESDLASLALRLGFVDQAHMTRVLRRELGSPPGRVREMLGRSAARETDNNRQAVESARPLA
jgi:AraC-like DNA-binding protein